MADDLRLGRVLFQERQEISGKTHVPSVPEKCGGI
jgi:hypothetical protein